MGKVSRDITVHDCIVAMADGCEGARKALEATKSEYGVVGLFKVCTYLDHAKVYGKDIAQLYVHVCQRDAVTFHKMVVGHMYDRVNLKEVLHESRN